MPKLRTALAALSFAIAIGAWTDAHPQEKKPITIGVLTDLSGVYSDLTGKGSVLAAQLAIDKFKGEVDGRPIKLLSADHLHKLELGSSIVRQWLDVDKVDAIVDVPNSGILLAVQEIVRKADRGVIIASGGQTSRFTNEACSPYGFQWTSNSTAIARGLATMAQAPDAKTWFLIQPDYAFGDAIAKDLEVAIPANGGKVLQKIKHPLNNADFGSHLLQAQASKANVVAFLNAGSDLANSLKQADDFGIAKSQKLATSSLFITTVKAVGLDLTKGLIAANGYYWDQSPEARQWSQAFIAKSGVAPTAFQIGVYSGVLHYLKAVEQAWSDDREKIVAAMRAMPVNDEFVKSGKAREDGAMVSDMLLLQVKSPAESKGEWDFFKILRTIPGDQAYGPLSESRCPLLKNG